MVYDHSDIGNINDMIRGIHDEYNRILVVTDGVFHGKRSPLLRDRYNSLRISLFANAFGRMYRRVIVPYDRFRMPASASDSVLPGWYR